MGQVQKNSHHRQHFNYLAQISPGSSRRNNCKAGHIAREKQYSMLNINNHKIIVIHMSLVISSIIITITQAHQRIGIHLGRGIIIGAIKLN